MCRIQGVFWSGVVVPMIRGVVPDVLCDEVELLARAQPHSALCLCCDSNEGYASLLGWVRVYPLIDMPHCVIN